VEIFDGQGVSFVSVTQQFNTTSSMGRLTLNVLLSFAQFEREVTGERIRDKIAASKKKGMWMGGNVPLGYDANERTLVANPAEAETVRRIFALYRGSAACAGSRRRPTVSGFGRNVAERRMATSAAANPSPVVISTHCSRTRSTPVRLRTGVSST
jgi:DNA invertase Pin-like site-specific DNA recombinase